MDEDEFLGLLIRAELREDQTARIAGSVLLAIAQPVSPPRWIELDVTQRQMETLCLSGSAAGEPAKLRGMLRQVLRGEPVTDCIFEDARSISSAVHRYWLKSCAPTLSPTGKVESIVLVGLEISEQARAGLERATMGEVEVMA